MNPVRILFHQRSATKVPRIYLFALACTYSTAHRQGDGRVKNEKINEKAPRVCLEITEPEMTQGNLEQHADHLARKVDRSSGDSDGSAVNRSSLHLSIFPS